MIRGMQAQLEDLVFQNGLSSIYEKVMEGERLSYEDGVTLYKSNNLAAIGALANMVRERKNGNTAYYVRNMHINYTNVCNKFCTFCAFQRTPIQEGAYTWDLKQIEEKVKEFMHVPISEIHMVAGINTKLPYEYYPDLLRTVKRLRPEVTIKAFTMIEIYHIAKISKKPFDETIAELKEAGLDALPGGGAEILTDRVHKEIFPNKQGPDEWLAMAKRLHELGLRSNATMLYGHIETLEERVEHLIKLRELQDETGGFLAFIPLAFHPENTGLAHLPSTTGFDDLKNIAVSRLLFDNIDHIKSFWIMITPRVAQLSLSFGADDMDGTILEEKITHDAGARTPQSLTQKEMVRLIKEAGRDPFERNALYQPVTSA